MTGRMYSDSAATLSALLIFVGFNLTFGPQFILGYLGMPRRYHVYPEEYQVLNVLSSAGASILGVGYALLAVYLIYSLFRGERAGANPWLATGLEWNNTDSPPLPHNFSEMPVVSEGAYEYSKRGIKVA
jgi:cytochrome c oxidase subunit 1